VATELRGISDPFTRDQAKQQISQILFDAKWRNQASRSQMRLSAPALQCPTPETWETEKWINHNSGAFGAVVPQYGPPLGSLVECLEPTVPTSFVGQTFYQM